MFVKIMYYKPELDLRRTGDGYGGAECTYKTALPLKKGDIVVAPTYKGDQKALVTQTFVPQSEINPAWADKIREITAFWQEDGANG